MFRRLLPVVLSIQMLLSLTTARPALVSAASKTPETTETEEQQPLTEDGTYAPGEVIVMFRSGAVKDAKMSLSKAQALDNVDEHDVGKILGCDDMRGGRTHVPRADDGYFGHRSLLDCHGCPVWCLTL